MKFNMLPTDTLLSTNITAYPYNRSGHSGPNQIKMYAL